MKYMKYIVVDVEEGFQDLLFNTDSQDYYFPTLKAAREGIKDHLDEPIQMDLDSGEVETLRDEGASEKDFVIYKLVRVK